MKKTATMLVLSLVAIMAFGTAVAGNGVVVYAKNQTSTDTITSLDSQRTDIAQVFITTSDTINKAEYIPAVISVVDKKNGTCSTILDNEAKIKVRGNSTANLEKQPFNFKLSSSQSVLGMPEGKKWCLLANYLDPTLMRNKMAYDFAENIGLPYSCQTRYVDVWLNGKYNGNYLITVPVEVGSNRVDINADSNQYLLEIQKARVEEGVNYLCSGIYRFQMGEPESLSEEQSKYLSDFLIKAEVAMKSGDAQKIREYVDFETFIDFYIIQELFKNKDFNVSSTRFYIKNNKLYAGPLWDFDLSCGNVSKYPYYNDFLCYNNYGQYGSGSGNSYEGLWTINSSANQTGTSWIELLMNCDEFSSAFYERYIELQDQITNLYQDNTLGTNQIDFLSKEYDSAFDRDVSKWPISAYKGSELNRTEEKTYNESVVFLRSFLKNRNEWLLTALTSFKSETATASVAPKTAVPTNSKVLINGVETSFEAYNIDGNNYFKLRDLANTLSVTSKQFEIVWDNEKGAINLVSNKPYTVVGGELQKGDGCSKLYSQCASKIFKDGNGINPTAYTISGNNYFKLRDIAALFNFAVNWDGTKGTIAIDTNSSYLEE